MRIADHPGDARKLRNFFRSALRVTTGDHDARSGIRAMNLAHGIARLRIGGGGYGAGVQHHDVSGSVLLEHASIRRCAERDASPRRLLRWRDSQNFPGKR